MAYLQHMEKYRNKKLERQEQHGKILFEKFIKYFDNKYLLIVRPSWSGKETFFYKYDFKGDKYIFSSQTGPSYIFTSEGKELQPAFWSQPVEDFSFMDIPPNHHVLHIKGIAIDLERLFDSYRHRGIIDLGLSQKCKCYIFDTEEERDLFYEASYVF